MRTIKNILKIILGIVLSVSLIASILCLTLKDTLFSAEKLADGLYSNSYKSEIITAVREELKNKSMLIGMAGEDFVPDVKDEEISECAKAYIKEIALYITSGKPIEQPEFKSETLYKQIYDRLSGYAADNGIELETDSAERIYESLTSAAAVKTNVIAAEYIENYIPDLSDFSGYIKYALVLPIIAIAAFALIFILEVKKPISALYSALTPVWIGSALVFIPALMLRIYNLPKHIVLDNSPIKSLVSSALTLLIYRIVFFSGIVLLISTILLAVFILFLSRVNKSSEPDDIRKSERRKIEKHSSSKSKRKKNTKQRKQNIQHYSEQDTRNDENISYDNVNVSPSQYPDIHEDIENGELEYPYETEGFQDSSESNTETDFPGTKNN